MIVQTATNSFKTQLAQAGHNFGPTNPDVFALALYDSTAELNAATETYTVFGEISGGSYVPGGKALNITATPTSTDGVTYFSFADATWDGALTARGGLIYNASKGNASVAVLNFGADKTSVTSFAVQFPPATATTAVIRIK